MTTPQPPRDPGRPDKPMKEDVPKDKTSWRRDATMKAILALLAVTFILSVVTSIQLQFRNRDLDSLQTSSDKIEASTTDVQTQVRDLEELTRHVEEIAQSFVRDPEAPPSERDQELAKVFRMIEAMYAKIVGEPIP